MQEPNDLDAWLAGELAKLYTTEPTNNPGMLLGFPVWGAKYIERFAEFCLPSLLAPKNAEALRKLNAKVLIYTTAEDFKHLWRRTWPIERAAIRLEFGYFPKELLASEDPNQKYMVLGTIQNLLVQRAARSGMGFHMIMPDIIYSERYFEALSGLVANHEAIANSCLSSNIVTIRPEIQGYRASDGLISIPAATLGDMSWRHVHQQFAAILMNGREVPARANVIAWRGHDAIHIAGPHINPVWMGPGLCRRAPVLSPTSLDAEIPSLMPNGYYMPGPDDDMAVAELSDDAKGAARQGDIDDFLSLCWIQMNFNSNYLPVMRERTRIAVAPQADGMADADIASQHAALMDRLVAEKLQTMEGWMLYLSRRHRRMLRT